MAHISPPRPAYRPIGEDGLDTGQRSTLKQRVLHNAYVFLYKDGNRADMRGYVPQDVTMDQDSRETTLWGLHLRLLRRFAAIADPRTTAEEKKRHQDITRQDMRKNLDKFKGHHLTVDHLLRNYNQARRYENWKYRKEHPTPPVKREPNHFQSSNDADPVNEDSVIKEKPPAKRPKIRTEVNVDSEMSDANAEVVTLMQQLARSHEPELTRASTASAHVDITGASGPSGFSMASGTPDQTTVPQTPFTCSQYPQPTEVVVPVGSPSQSLDRQSLDLQSAPQNLSSPLESATHNHQVEPEIDRNSPVLHPAPVSTTAPPTPNATPNTSTTTHTPLDNMEIDEKPQPGSTATQEHRTQVFEVIEIDSDDDEGNHVRGGGATNDIDCKITKCDDEGPDAQHSVGEGQTKQLQRKALLEHLAANARERNRNRLELQRIEAQMRGDELAKKDEELKKQLQALDRKG